MKITEESIKFLNISEKNKKLLNALLKDMEELNNMTKELGKDNVICIYWQDWHNDYSPERTDPCPDYYGTYSLVDNKSKEWIGNPMTIEQLDEHICTIVNLLEVLTEKYKN